jgi:hypothetical protein
MCSRILQIIFSLLLGSFSIAFAQGQYDLPKESDRAAAGLGQKSASTNLFVSSGDLKDGTVPVPAPKDPPDPELSYSLAPREQRSDVELDHLGPTSRIHLADLARTASSSGWAIGDGGILSYRAPDRRWHLVFRYSPDVRSLREGFDRLEFFSVVLQRSLGKRKPAR